MKLLPMKLLPMKVPRTQPALLLVLLLAAGIAFASPEARAQTRYIAFGDSITDGVGDSSGSDARGYPARLETLLSQGGVVADVDSFGVPGEITAEGLRRFGSVPGGGGDILLLMEGTNDITARISPETIRFNLQEIARRAENRGMTVVHATSIPRHPNANFDGQNRAAAAFAGELRNLAWAEERSLVDPFDAFIRTPGVFNALFVGNGDWFHPNAAGYDVLAQTFADAILGTDNVPPVTGLIFPADDQQQVAPRTEVQVDVYDFGDGLDTAATTLLINGQAVTAEITGGQVRQQIRYSPPSPFVGVVFVGLRAQDLATPANTVDRTLAQFVIRGTQFLDGDIDRDGRVDGADLIALGQRFGATRGQERYRGFADLDGDDDIDGDDLAILASNFGQSAF